MLKTIVIDSDAESLKIIERFISKSADIKLYKTFTDNDDAVNYVSKFPVDLCITGINSAKEKAYHSLAAIGEKAKLIITSNSPEYAVDAFNLNAIDYILKPLNENRFSEAIGKAKAHHSLMNKASLPQDHFFIRADYNLIKIHFNDILYIEGLDDYLKIHLSTSKIIVARCTLKALSEKLHNRNFMRVHRSFIVPLEKIHKVTKRSLSINDNIIPIGNRYVQSFNSAFTMMASA